MDGELLSLKWNNHKSSFLQSIQRLRSGESYTDATLTCNGKFYQVHKIVMSTCSDFFKEIFDMTPGSNPVIVLKNMDCLEPLLDYMYLGEVNVKQSDLPALIKAAEALKIKGLAVSNDEVDLEQCKKNNQTENLYNSSKKRPVRSPDTIKLNSPKRPRLQQINSNPGSHNNPSAKLKSEVEEDEETSISSITNLDDIEPKKEPDSEQEVWDELEYGQTYNEDAYHHDDSLQENSNQFDLGLTYSEQFRCSQCTYTSAWKVNLIRHMRIHSDIRKACPICSFTCTDSSSLKRHGRIHATNVE